MFFAYARFVNYLVSNSDFFGYILYEVNMYFLVSDKVYITNYFSLSANAVDVAKALENIFRKSGYSTIILYFLLYFSKCIQMIHNM